MIYKNIKFHSEKEKKNCLIFCNKYGHLVSIHYQNTQNLLCKLKLRYLNSEAYVLKRSDKV